MTTTANTPPTTPRDLVFQAGIYYDFDAGEILPNDAFCNRFEETGHLPHSVVWVDWYKTGRISGAHQNHLIEDRFPLLDRIGEEVLVGSLVLNGMRLKVVGVSQYVWRIAFVGRPLYGDTTHLRVATRCSYAAHNDEEIRTITVRPLTDPDDSDVTDEDLLFQHHHGSRRLASLERRVMALEGVRLAASRSDPEDAT